MSDFRYYLSIFLRRLPLFLPMMMVISAVSVIVAMTLPPAYVSEMQLVVESPQIPDELAPSTVRIPPLELLQIIRQRLLTRANLLDIARRLEALPDLEDLTPDDIVEAMRARTNIKMSSDLGEATLMWIDFEASDPRTAAAVLGEYLTLIQQEDARFRQGRAGETLEFFNQQVEQLSQEIDQLSARILSYKNENSDSLPETLDFRLNQQERIQDRLGDISREITILNEQRDRLVEIFESTGQITNEGVARPLTGEEQRLEQLRNELQQALVVFSEESPRVKLLRAQIKQAEASLNEVISNESNEDVANYVDTTGPPSALEIRLSEIDSRLTSLDQDREIGEQQLEILNDSIRRTPEVSIHLEELERQFSTVQQQYALSQNRLSTARTGELIETRSRGQEISVIEPPAIPSTPTKPNRLLIAVGGVIFSIIAGLALVILVEAFNSSARRPEDLVKRFNIIPISTIPFIRTQRQIFVQRTIKVLILLIILVGTPAVVYAVHIFYLPLDLLADRVMNKLGVRL